MRARHSKWLQRAGGAVLACLLGFQMLPGLAPFIAVARAESRAAGARVGQDLAQRLDALAESQVLGDYAKLQQEYLRQQIEKMARDAEQLKNSPEAAIFRDAVGDFSWAKAPISEAASLGYYGQPQAIANELIRKAKAGVIQDLARKYSAEELEKLSNERILQEMGKSFPGVASQVGGDVVYTSNNPVIQYLNKVNKDEFIQSVTSSVKDYVKQQVEDYFKEWIRNLIRENITTKISSETVKNIPYIGPYLSWYMTQRQKWMNQTHQNEQKKEEGKLDRKKIEYENKMKRQEADMIWGKQPLPGYPREIDSSIYGTSGGMNANQRVIEQFANQDRGSLAEWLFYGDQPVSFYGWLAAYPAERRKEIMTPYEIGPNLDAEGKPVKSSEADKENVRRNAWLTLGIEPLPPFAARTGAAGFQEELAIRAQYASVLTQSYDGYVKGWMAQDRMNQLMSTLQMFTPQVIDGLSVGQTNGCGAMLHQLSAEVQMQIFQSKLRFERLRASSMGLEAKLVRENQLRELGQGAPVGAIAGQ
ncbi:hypothetical protein DK842_22705 [Chromobacterium phragmitis]|uniref:hypothetical protein n=1 Tax=Chromobacterium phragmitis TaxID=2202141 RepID=UPI000DEC2FD3|nr:hypothetical protein [Chromobacterium phragmitis]AXE32478.1 hypothetical protein DK842_22705 [Chromobacterium phragmitis]